MSIYNAPVSNMSFILHDMFQLSSFLEKLEHPSGCDEELMNAILEEAAKFCSQVLAPLYQSGDEQGCQFDNGKVTTPDGFKEAYQQFVEAGWPAFSANPEFGGQGMPKSLQVLMEEMLHGSNSSFCLYNSLTNGAVHALEHHANESLKQQWLPRLISGEWSGTMCLTESHAGTDLGLIKTHAVEGENESYLINGSKIFITGGEHDLSENIIHLVLAKLPDAPEGVKGISMFIVPKFLINDDGVPSERNNVTCGAIEHKMGIKASSTCVMNFDNAIGYLVGEKHQGIRYMFSMMNNERLSIGIQGIGLAERSYQTAVTYARERLQSHAPLSKVKGPNAIIEHPDVRRMLLWMRAQIEAMRMSTVWLGMEIDQAQFASENQAIEKSSKLIAFLTPVAKAYYSDTGFAACNHGIQILGGHGYIREWGQEQLVRDARIAQIYEGTNGIQAMDLIGRKLLMDKGEGFQLFDQWLTDAVNKALNSPIKEHLKTTINNIVVEAQYELRQSVEWLIEQCPQRPALAGAVATSLLQWVGLCWMSGMWCLALSSVNQSLYLKEEHKQIEKTLAQFFMESILTQYTHLKHCIVTGENALMKVEGQYL